MNLKTVFFLSVLDLTDLTDSKLKKTHLPFSSFQETPSDESFNILTLISLWRESSRSCFLWIKLDSFSSFCCSAAWTRCCFSVSCWNVRVVNVCLVQFSFLCNRDFLDKSSLDEPSEAAGSDRSLCINSRLNCCIYIFWHVCFVYFSFVTVAVFYLKWTFQVIFMKR